MKKISTLLIATVLSISLFADARPATLSVTAIGNTNIRVMVDNNRYENYGNSVVVSDLSGGYHNIKVYQVNNNNRFAANNRLIYSSSMLVKPSYQVNIVINRNGKAVIDEQPLYTGPKYGDRDRDNNGRGNDRGGYDGRRDDQYDRNDRNDRNDRDYGRIQTMSNDRFANAMSVISREFSDKSKFTIAKQVIEDNYLCVSQVKQMMQQFSFDVNKLELAQYAYKRTTDPNNYFMLYDEFSFSTYKERLAEFVRNNR